MTFFEEEDEAVAPEAAGGRSHFRRYGVFYAVGVAVLVAAVLVPVLSSGDDDEKKPVVAGPAAAPADDGPWKPGSGDLVHGEGTTRSGAKCTEGTHQIPETTYSVPCLPKFTGDNGGATSTGVTADTIRIVLRRFPTTANQQTAQQAAEDAGYAGPTESYAVAKQWMDKFNELYELYGRKIEFVEYTSQFGDGTAEALGGGREGACADATKIVEELHAFGVITQPGLVGDSSSSTGVFSDCAAERGLVVFDGAPYYTEKYYQERDPNVWSTVMECERIGYQLPEYLGKRLVGKPAKYAGGDLQDKPRKLGVYVPDDPQYVRCILDIAEKQLQSKYNSGWEAKVTYQLDISRFAEQAQRAIVQYKAAGVTSIVTACDPLSIIFLTQAAKQQNYFPEWVITGVAATDTDNFGRLYDQEVVAGRLFGMSQLGSTSKTYGADSEPNKLYKATFGKDLPKGTTGWFYSLINVFNLVQSAGPDLAAANIGTGVTRLPELGGPSYAVGLWSWSTNPDGTRGHDHTAIDDSRQVYWDAEAISPSDGKKGSWIETDGGKRYRNGEWPTTDPDIFPGQA